MGTIVIRDISERATTLVKSMILAGATMKLNLRRTGDGYETKFYSPDGKPLRGVAPEEMLAKGSQVTALMECSDVWIAGTGKFSVRWNASQIIVQKMAESGA
jgi:hypothetical protein